LARATSRHETAAVAVDVVLLTIEKGELSAFLVCLKEGPLRGKWAFPGGRVRLDEPLEDAARRELREQTGLADVYLEQLYTFGDPDRDPTSRVVSVAYFALVPTAPALRRTARYAAAAWFPVRALPALTYDHDRIAAMALERLRAKLSYTNIAWSLLPRAFTLGDLQAVYETILGRRLDRRNFRRKLLGLGLLRPLSRERRGAHRPATLYAFRSRRPLIAEVL